MTLQYLFRLERERERERERGGGGGGGGREGVGRRERMNDVTIFISVTLRSLHYSFWFSCEARESHEQSSPRCSSWN